MSKSFLSEDAEDCVVGAGGTGAAKIAGRKFVLPYATLAATGEDQDHAAQIASIVTFVTSTANNISVKLPSAPLGSIYVIAADAAGEAQITVFGEDSSVTINGDPGEDGVSLSAGRVYFLCRVAEDQWTCAT